jgi:peptidoglycan hydrolase-like protein with peptidoglycan-binding domain
MENLAYLHLAVADEASPYTHYTLTARWKNPKLLALLNSPLLTSRAAIPVVSLAVAVGILGVAKQASATVKFGERSPEVAALQQRLQKLGYFNTKATGYYGPITREAVMRYQQAQGLTPDGVVGPNTQAALGTSRSQAAEEPVHPTWKVGDSGSKVKEIQEKLAMAGYPASTNGVFDEQTREAVQLFQQAKKLSVDGIVGKNTLAALSDNSSNQSTLPEEEQATPEFRLESPQTPVESPQLTPERPQATSESPSVTQASPQLTPESSPLTSESEQRNDIRWSTIQEPTSSGMEEPASNIWRMGDRGAKVTEIQKSLAAAGFQADTDGVFDEETEKAVRQFQQTKGLKVDGIVGQQTLTALSDKSQPTPQTTPWYEDKSAPLSPFTR